MDSYTSASYPPSLGLFPTYGSLPSTCFSELCDAEDGLCTSSWHPAHGTTSYLSPPAPSSTNSTLSSYASSSSSSSDHNSPSSLYDTPLPQFIHPPSICPTFLLQSALVPDPSFGSVRRPKPVRASRGQQEAMMQNEVYVLKLMMGGGQRGEGRAVSKRAGMGRRSVSQTMVPTTSTLGTKKMGLGKGLAIQSQAKRRTEPLSTTLALLRAAEGRGPPTGGSMMGYLGGGTHWVGGCSG